MDKEQEKEKLNPYIVGFMVILGIAVGVEVIIFGYGMVMADEVECHWWGCEFTDVREINVHRNCSMKGIPVNCSIIEEELGKYGK